MDGFSKITHGHVFYGVLPPKGASPLRLLIYSFYLFSPILKSADCFFCSRHFCGFSFIHGGEALDSSCVFCTGGVLVRFTRCAVERRILHIRIIRKAVEQILKRIIFAPQPETGIYRLPRTEPFR
jgi:hypothetical protein